MNLFPLRLVQHFDPGTNLWRARRGPGNALAQTGYIFGDHPGAIQLDAVPAAPASFTAHLATDALADLSRRFADVEAIRRLHRSFSGSRIAVEIWRDHETLVGLDGKTLLIAGDIPDLLGLADEDQANEAPKNQASKDQNLDDTGLDHNPPADETQRAFSLLLALEQYCALLQLDGASPRTAIHHLLDLYDRLERGERGQILRLLSGPHLDSGNLLGLFLRRAGGLGDSDTQRDLHITWLLGQDRIDLPYDRQAVSETLHSDIDPDQKRFALFTLLRGYDRDLERDNIGRLTAAVRQAGQQLVFGRMSRAFHNQATLFADAVVLTPQAEWRDLAARLEESCAAAPPLQPHAQALCLLLESPESVPLIQLEGACERFEEETLEEQKRQTLEFLAPARRSLEDHGQEGPRPELPAFAASGINAEASDRLSAVEAVRHALLAAPRRHAAYVIVSQRPSPTGSHLLAKINEFEDPYLGKAENLRKLARLAGDRLYSSPDYRWLEVADHWIEAIPLFIKEEVLIEDGHERTRTVIDIAGMEESFREEMADHWARNIRRVWISQVFALARQLVDTGSLAAESPQAAQGRNDRLREAATDIAAVARLLAALYGNHIGTVQALVESDEIAPHRAMAQVLATDTAITDLAAAATKSGWSRVADDALATLSGTAALQDDFVAADAFLPQRSLPTLHVLTTQSAGMTEGYIRTWLEESMALYNVVTTHLLEDEVAGQRALYGERLLLLGERIIRDLGIWVEVEEAAAREQVAPRAAVSRVLNANAKVQREVALLAVLLELEAADATAVDYTAEPERVSTILERERDAVQHEALGEVAERNGEELARAVAAVRASHPSFDHAQALRLAVSDDEHYRADLETYARFAARRRALEQWQAERPELHIDERVASYLRRYQRLATTTARKEIIARHGLAHLTLAPEHYYQAAGGRKRYHLLYTPSRVDLGKRERESVESWSQWVGGADRAAARVGRQIYGLINKNVRSFDSLSEPEVLKTGENASMASHFAFSNALSLMVTAARHGDFEEMGDQMSRRKDRLIHPAGEAYGGYCVPKDGLFLEFVLSLGRSEKLHQLGLPTAAHDGVVALSRHLLQRRGDFSGQLEWEAWSATLLADRQELDQCFALRGDTPVFQITRIAHVLDNLGQPELRDPDRLGTSLAARWGIHKMVAGGEHVNRFMPFFKTWLIRRGMRKAAQLNPGLPVDPDHFVVVLSAEYKPDTQDGRFAAGMRKFEILAGTGSHLLYALDAEGQQLALLLHEGFAALRQRGKEADLLRHFGVAADDEATLARLEELFPAYAPPAEIRLVSPTGLSTQDVLGYTSDTNLEEVADGIRRQLQQAGFTDGEIDANLEVHGPDPVLWDHLAPITPQTKEQLRDQTCGRIHALHLAVVGPEPSYLRALQGADILDTGIPHTGLLDLLADPARVCDLMLAANPNSALVLVDGASGARRRALNRLDVMLWFAASERPSVPGPDRQAVYLGIGLGEETVESWRQTMRRQRRRSQRLGQAVKSGDQQEATRLFAELQEDLRQEQEVQQQLSETEKLARFGRGRDRDLLIGQRLAGLAGNRSLASTDFTDFLCLGGLFLLNGLPDHEIRAYRNAYEEGLNALGGPDAVPDAPLPVLVSPAYRVEAADFREEKGVESSNKAVEERPAVALEARRQLATRIAEARALNQRQQAFASVPLVANFDTARAQALEALGDGDSSVGEEAFGRFLGYARQALLALGDESYGGEHQEAADDFALRMSQLFNGRDIDLEDWRAVAGGYEDIGDFGRLAQHLKERADRENWQADRRRAGIERLAAGGELFYILLALEQTAAAARSDSEQTPDDLWRALADFFAETLNDHFYEYRPWLYARGVGFASYQDEDLYRLANRYHAWLYRYLRGVVVRHTEMSDLPLDERDLLMGCFVGGETVEAIGAGGPGEQEKIWRSYGQLRELAFMRNDGFPLPVVFADFDPDLLHADRRVNHVFTVPTGRTHYSRALPEGPTLARQLESQGRPGANLFISRFVEIVSDPDYPRPVAQLYSGHFYLDASTYAESLQRHKGFSVAEATAAAETVNAKGIRVAAAFSSPLLAAVVYPFHGSPLYVCGAYEDCGLPYAVQSLFHTWTTYDKAKYPDIFPATSGVEVPAEIDWLAAYTADDEAGARHAIEHGLEGSPYPGLRAFAADHRLVMVKDAAESGGRNAGAFVLRRLDGDFDESQVEAAVNFIFQISRKNNVAIQEVVVSSPEYWATEEFMRDFVRRQITDWQSSVDRQRQPRTPIYGSHRIILTTPDPAAPAAERWNISHWIALSSKQLITNVGRGGTLEEFLPDYIRPEHRQPILDKMAEAGRRVMEALAAYEERAADAYQRESGRPVGSDLAGVSYAMPRYMMLDFLIAPVFADKGSLVDIAPNFDAQGQRQASQFMLQNGEDFKPSPIVDWRAVLIEPNIGVGLWDRVALRESERETRRAHQEGTEIDWDRIGSNARTVLADLSQAGEDYLKALGTL
jgi:hypothetical protein